MDVSQHRQPLGFTSSIVVHRDQGKADVSFAKRKKKIPPSEDTHTRAPTHTVVDHAASVTGKAAQSFSITLPCTGSP